MRTLCRKNYLGSLGRGTRTPNLTRQGQSRVLRATEGRFRNSILNVKHLLAPPKPSGKDMSEPKMRKDKHKGKGKQKGGRRKRR